MESLEHLTLAGMKQGLSRYSAVVIAQHRSRSIQYTIQTGWLLVVVVCSILLTSATVYAEPTRPLILACASDNDLFVVLQANQVRCKRYASSAEAIKNAPRGAGVLLLADGFPETTTPTDAATFDAARKKELRLYVEYPAMLPDIELGKPTFLKVGPYNAIVERLVVSSKAFEPGLAKMRILEFKGCHYLPVRVKNPHLVVARVEGYDTAVYGLPDAAHPILFEHPRGDVLVSTTKLSQFVTGRYAPTEAWPHVWRMILRWLEPGGEAPLLKWQATVRPMYRPADTLPADAQRVAARRGIEYYEKSRLYIHPDWPKDRGYDPLPADWPAGDGTHGIGECYISKRVFIDGTQAVSRTVRADCNLEAAMGLAAGVALLDEPKYEHKVRLLNDLIFFDSVICGGPRADPKSPSYGLIGGSEQSPGLYWGDDNARGLLSAIASAGLLESNRWDPSIVRGILANFRTSGVFGFRPQNIRENALQQQGWEHFFNLEHVDYCPHMEAWIWSTYLWLYDKTGYQPLLERSRTGLRMMMAAYPNWRLEANRVETERCRMLLPLAWLVRVDDTPEHRKWLDTIAQYIIDLQDESGAIPQIPGHVVGANEGYGAGECAIVHKAGDPATDALYAINFAFFGMHEAAVATGNKAYQKSADRIADFFIRSQTRSEKHPELDGTWYRGFDYKKWDYWGSDGDAGWGILSNEIGWTHSWIAATLAFREMKTNLWDISKTTTADKIFTDIRKQMLPVATGAISIEKIGGDVDKTSIRFNPPSKDSTVHYTTDGTEPTKDAPVASGVITVPKRSSIRARAFDADGEPASTLVVYNYWFLHVEQRDANDRGKGLVGGGISDEVTLTGDGQFIDLGDLKLKAPATVAMWIKGDTLDVDQRLFVHLSGPTTQGGQLRFDARRLQVYDGIGRDWQTLISDGLEPGKWAHIAVVYGKDGQVTGYLDGKAARSGTSPFAFDGVHAAIGAKWLGQYGKQFPGAIREVRIVGSALSPGEIKSLATKEANQSR